MAKKTKITKKQPAKKPAKKEVKVQPAKPTPKTTEPDALPMTNYDKKTWYEFRKTGLLAFVNTFLHIFGWAIVVVADAGDQVISIYPARTRFRGFSGESMGKAYVKLSEYMHKNHKKLLDEARS